MPVPSTRFAVAVHLLTGLARAGGRPVTSARLAASASTEPSVVRRLLARLARAGLVEARPGSRGGAVLARPPESIRLLDVFRAVEGDEQQEGTPARAGAGAVPLLAVPRGAPNPACPIARNVRAVLAESALDRATAAFERELAASTLAEVVAGIAERERRERARGGREAHAPGPPAPAAVS